MPHTDGPVYVPRVAILSLGCAANFQFSNSQGKLQLELALQVVQLTETPGGSLVSGTPTALAAPT